MKSFNQFNEDLAARRAALADASKSNLQRASDSKKEYHNSLQARKDAEDDEQRRDADKEEIKREVKKELGIKEETAMQMSPQEVALQKRKAMLDQKIALQRKKSLVQSKGEVKEETYDPEVQGRSQIRKTGEGGRSYPSKKKSDAEIRRMKAVGGGKMEPVRYKDRKDIGSQKKTTDRVQQPEKERGSKEVAKSYADKVKAERRAAAQARAAAKKGGEKPAAAPKPKAKDASKEASKLLSKKKAEKPVSPNYKPQKASGMTRQERMKVTRAGERELSKEFKKQEMDKVKRKPVRKQPAN